MKSPHILARSKELARKHVGKLFVFQAIALLALGYLLAWRAGGPEESGASESGAAVEAPAGPQIWTCSMHPQIRRDGPGKCPLCGMDLVPVTSGSGGLRTLTVSPEARALMNIQTSPAERKYVSVDVRMVGKVDYDETRLKYITAWIPGRLDRLYVDYTGIEVKKGDHMVYLYSEALYSAQEELLQALKYEEERSAVTPRPSSGISLVDSAREKLRLLGLTEEQIKEIEERNKPSEHMTIYSPISGIVVHKNKQEGDRVNLGDRIYTVADLSQVWVKLDAYESDLIWLRYGQKATFETEAYPGEKFEGRISFVDPVLNDKTRTVKVRVNVPNAEGKLKPDMFVRATVRSHVAAGGRVLDADMAGKWISPMHPEIVKDEPGNCDICGMPLVRAETLGYVAAERDPQQKPLVIPVSAALLTGTRAIVYVEIPDAKEPTFEGREIVLGPRAGDYYIVRSGLGESELVVTHGNFKIDSEIQIQAKPSMMTPEGGGGGGHDHGEHAKSKASHGGHASGLPMSFVEQARAVDNAFDAVTEAVKLADLHKIRVAFGGFGDVLNGVDASVLSGHALMVWNDVAMLLNNDVVEGREVADMKSADRVFLSLKNHVRRMRRQLGISPAPADPKRIEVSAEFQAQLAKLWHAYLPLQQTLAGDDFTNSRLAVDALSAALAAADDEILSDEARKAWHKERANMVKVLKAMEKAEDIERLRAAFSLLSDEIGVLLKSFGVGDVGPIYQLHCPMAFEGRGAMWFQDNDQTRNPYYGSTMLKCADLVKRIDVEQPDGTDESGAHQEEHAHH